MPRGWPSRAGGRRPRDPARPLHPDERHDLRGITITGGSAVDELPGPDGRAPLER